MRHGKIKELFTGRRNVFTVTAVFIGGYFIAYPLVNISLNKIGDLKTIIIGFIILIIGDYILDIFHKK
jgi:fucose permease